MPSPRLRSKIRSAIARPPIAEELASLDPTTYAFVLSNWLAGTAGAHRANGDNDRALHFLRLARDVEDRSWQRWPDGPESVRTPQEIVR